MPADLVLALTRAPELPPGLGLTAALAAVGVSAGVFVRGLKAPRTRAAAELGLCLAFAAAGAAVVAAWRAEPELPRRVAFAAAAVSAGLAHSVYFGFVPLPGGRTFARATLARVGLTTGFAAGAAFAFPAWTWLAWPALAGGLATLWTWIATAPGRKVPKEVLRGETWLASVRFPCPRCGVVADWGDAVTPCPECGLFVHLVWDPEGGEVARFAPEDPEPGSYARFTCLGCRNEVDWMRGTTVCAVCGKKLRLHWNVHA